MDEVKIHLLGWSQHGERIDTPLGFNVNDFFTAAGVYLGADKDGIAPVIEIPTQI